MTTQPISWQAAEYLQTQKNFGWYLGFALIGLLLLALSIIFQNWTFTALIIITVISLLIYILRPARRLSYSLTAEGLTEENRLYPFEQFKSFGILSENGHHSIVLTPRKRFSPRITVFFPEAQGEVIVDAFGAHLPMEAVHLDFLDRLIRILRI